MVRTVKTDKTASERMARKRLRDKIEKGLVGVTVKVHESRKADIRAAAKTMQEPKREGDE
jgi:hypothetical protein